MSTMVSASTASVEQTFRDVLAVDELPVAGRPPAAASASSSWRHVTVCVRRPSRSRRRLFAHELERVGDAGKTLRVA